jgi:formate dehydrogenase major subunit
MVQLGKQAIKPPGDARQDLWILQQIARRMGLGWTYMSEASFAGDGFADQSGAANVYEEMRQAMHTAISGITWERLLQESSVTYPCLSADDPGSPTVFIDDFPTADGRVKLVPADIIPANERPDTEFPMVLITGRQLEHWHTGSMTRRATVLDAIEPQATVSMNGADMDKQGIRAGDVVTIQSRRGEVALHVRRDDGTPNGVVFIPFAYYEAAANKLTNSAYDPVAKIPEFKYCAVRVTKGGDMGDEFGFQTNAKDEAVAHA